MVLMRSIGAALVLAVLGMQTVDAAAQSSGCRSVSADHPPRRIFACPGGLKIDAEAAAALHILPAPKGRRPERAELDRKAVLIDLTPGSGSFEILTPQAIASVRGTIYAVDVAKAATSVFVKRGRVRVSRRRGSGAVTLGPGEGVEVAPGRPLIVKRWPRQKVSRLFARFGQ